MFMNIMMANGLLKIAIGVVFQLIVKEPLIKKNH